MTDISKLGLQKTVVMQGKEIAELKRTIENLIETLNETHAGFI